MDINQKNCSPFFRSNSLEIILILWFALFISNSVEPALLLTLIVFLIAQMFYDTAKYYYLQSNKTNPFSSKSIPLHILGIFISLAAGCLFTYAFYYVGYTGIFGITEKLFGLK